MDMVGHEAIGPAGDAIGGATLREEITIEGIIAFLHENRLSPIATLRDMMRKIGDNDASKAGHEAIVALRGLFCNWYHVTVKAKETATEKMEECLERG
jgi:hypothetical protein